MIAYDLETAIMQRGYKREQGLILEIGACDIFHPERQFRCFVNPCPTKLTAENYMEELISAGARRYPTATHCNNIRYDPEMALPLSLALAEFLNFVGTDAVLVAHNGRSFDDKIVSGALSREGLEWGKGTNFLDSYHDVCKKVWPGRRTGGYKLGNLYKKFCVHDNQSMKWHTALDDSIALSRIINTAAKETVLNNMEASGHYVEKEYGLDKMNRELGVRLPKGFSDTIGKETRAVVENILRKRTTHTVTDLCIKICLGAGLWLPRKLRG